MLLILTGEDLENSIEEWGHIIIFKVRKFLNKRYLYSTLNFRCIPILTYVLENYGWKINPFKFSGLATFPYL